jgi:hypothetical protein
VSKNVTVTLAQMRKAKKNAKIYAKKQEKLTQDTEKTLDN